MVRVSKSLAKQLAPQLPERCTQEEARDLLDEMTTGDLDCWQMDKLIDWTFQERGWSKT